MVPSAICALTVFLLDPFLGIGGESALFFIGVLVVALLGGVAPAALSAVLSGLLLNYFLIEPRHTFTIAEPDSAVTIVVLLLVAVAVAVLVDGAAQAGPRGHGRHRRRPSCWRCSPVRCCAAPTSRRCWNGCGRRIPNAP